MSIPKIDPYPPAPTPEDDEATFDEKAYEHAASLETRRVQMNEVATYVNTRASDANNRAVAAAASATASANSATRSDEWANKAPGSVVATGKYSARHYSDLSDKFANAPEDVEVEPGKYSALHWQEKAKKIADVHATTVATDPLPTVLATNVQEALRDLAYQSDQLRIAKNQLKYGDGPYPALDFQFQGAKYLDPRIEFTRASVDWDEEGNEYGIDEPVLTDKGGWVSGARANLLLQSSDLAKTPWVAVNGTIKKLEGVKSPVGTDSFSLSSDGSASQYIRQPATLTEGAVYTVSCFVRFESGEEMYRLGLLSSGFSDGGFSDFTINGSGELQGTNGGEGERLEAGWYRIWKTGVASVSATASYIQIHAYPQDPLVDKYISAPQFEVGVGPTAFIPTEGSQVTVANSFLNLPYNLNGDWTVIVDFTPIAPTLNSTVTGFFGISGGPYNTIALTGHADLMRLTYYGTGSGNQVSTNLVYGQRYKVAISMKNDRVTFWLNGEKLLTAHELTLGIVNNFDTLALGRHMPTAISTAGDNLFKGVSIFDKALSDEQLQELTTL